MKEQAFIEVPREVGKNLVGLPDSEQFMLLTKARYSVEIFPNYLKINSARRRCSIMNGVSDAVSVFKNVQRNR